MVRKLKGGFVKLNFKVAFPEEKNDLHVLKVVLSKGGFVKPATVT